MKRHNKNYIQMITETLETAGVESGQQLLDFGCGGGDYTIPAAKIIGENGVVYAVDRDKASLNRLWGKSVSMGLNNIQVVNTSGDLDLPFPDESMDFILLYDVLHSFYFTPSQRQRFLKEIYRIAKKECVISVYPQHMDSNISVNEMADRGIHLHETLYVDLLHYHVFEQGHLFNFRVD